VIIERAGTLRLPAIYQWPEVAEQGGFIGYGPRIVQLFRDLLGRQLVKTLRGIAVWRLMTNSNLVGCSTGRSAGLVVSGL
jgi:hypothetical protein